MAKKSPARTRIHTIVSAIAPLLRYATPMDTLIPAFLRRQRNQRRLTLEMMSASPPPTAASAATGRTKKPWMC